MSGQDNIQAWLKEHKIEDVELHPFMYEAIKAMESSDAMRKVLGDKFVTLYCALKGAECREFQEIVTPWEREVLLFNV